MECLICQDEISSDECFTILNCSCPYSYHNKCVKKWLNCKRSCPNCRNKWYKNPKESEEIRYRLRKRRNATYLDESSAEELQRRLFLESIGGYDNINGMVG